VSYDLASDPLQLENLNPVDPAAPEAAAEAELRRRLDELGDCAGIAGRDPWRSGSPSCE
jgi:hypothetical protein